MKGPKDSTARVEAGQTVIVRVADAGAGDFSLDEIEKAIHPLQDPERSAAERRYIRRLDWIILPTISSLYFFEYLDRGNVAVGSRRFVPECIAADRCRRMQNSTA